MPSDDSPNQADVANLLAVEAIRRLKYRYAGYCDQNYAPDSLAELFTEDAVWEGGMFGIHQGREAIRELFRGSGETVAFAAHYMLNPIIDVSDGRGIGSWYLWQSLVMKKDSKAFWLMGKYKDDYAIVDGEWKFANVKLTVDILTPYDDGPGKIRMAPFS